MKLYLIRHGATAGNLRHAFIGRTDEPLCPQGRAALRERHAPECDILLCSPMRRCVETAAILYPGRIPLRCGGLRECDFGAFEGKAHAALANDPAYRAWLEGGGCLPCPGASESTQDFRERCTAAFEALTRHFAGAQAVTMIVHGGTIMSVLHRYGRPQRDFYDYYVTNGGGFSGIWEAGVITGLEAL